MKFNVKLYKEMLNTGDAKYSEATKMLENAITTSDIKTSIELKALRTPGQVAHLELIRLKRSGFDMSVKTAYGTENISDGLILAFHAGYKHCKKHWPHLIERYDMSMYPLTEVKL